MHSHLGHLVLGVHVLVQGLPHKKAPVPILRLHLIEHLQRCFLVALEVAPLLDLVLVLISCRRLNQTLTAPLRKVKSSCDAGCRGGSCRARPAGPSLASRRHTAPLRRTSPAVVRRRTLVCVFLSLPLAGDTKTLDQ